MEEIKKYKSKGIVLGNYWGGGTGSYSCIKFESDISKEDLINQNNNALLNETLDSGMGYESLIGALIEVSIITEINKNNKIFTNTEEEIHFIGELSESQIEFLENVYYNN